MAINLFFKWSKKKQPTRHSHPFSFPSAHLISLLLGIQQGCVSNENLKIIIPKAKDILKTSRWLPPGGGAGGAGGVRVGERLISQCFVSFQVGILSDLTDSK